MSGNERSLFRVDCKDGPIRKYVCIAQTYSDAEALYQTIFSADDVEEIVPTPILRSTYIGSASLLEGLGIQCVEWCK